MNYWRRYQAWVAIPENVVTAHIYLFFFFLSIIAALDVGLNTVFICFLEWLFIFSYHWYLKKPSPLARLISEHKILSSLVFIWLIAGSLSLLLSPLELSGFEQFVSCFRFFICITHVLFAVYLSSYLGEYSPDIERVLKLICIFMLLLITNMLLVWVLYEDHRDPYVWFNAPPFYTHIRHAGYHITAVICVWLYFFFSSSTSIQQKLLTYGSGIIFWAFVFWLGGRGAAFSLVLTCLFVLLLLKYLKIPILSHALWLLGIIFAGFFISEVVSVMPWNGIVTHVQRTVAASEDVRLLTSGRTEIWQMCLRALEGNWLLGLGANSYVYLPEYFFGVQPHSLFIQFALDWGLLGGIPALLFLFMAYVLGLRNLISRSRLSTGIVTSDLALIVSGVALISALTLSGFIDGTYYHAQPSSFLVLGFALALIRFKKPVQ